MGREAEDNKMNEKPHQIICILYGGPEYDILVGSKSYHFEDHPYCGPNIIHKITKSVRKNQPKDFLRAVSLWAQQGRKVDKKGFAIWRNELKP